jgi:hypothetical protein
VQVADSLINQSITGVHPMTNPEYAFPRVTYEEIPGAPGLTKREYFAALAMQGLLACPAEGEICKAGMSRLAVSIADSLIAELAKK